MEELRVSVKIGDIPLAAVFYLNKVPFCYLYVFLHLPLNLL